MVSRAGVLRVAAGVFPGFTAVALWLLVASWPGWWGVLGRFLAFWLLSSEFIFAAVLVHLFGPRQFLYKGEDWEDPTNQYQPTGYDPGKWNVLLDTHFHTKYSDGVLDVAEAVQWHIAMGFNAFFITDHDTLANQAAIRALKDRHADEILLMQGVELSTPFGHLCVLGCETWDFTKYAGMEREAHLKAIVADAHAQGAVVTINHYPWSTGGAKPRYAPEVHLSRDEARAWGVDLMECVNWDDDIAPIDMKSYAFCQAHPGIGPVAATDVHDPAKDRLYGWTLVHVPEFTEAAVMAELRAHRTDVLFRPEGVTYPTRHAENPKFKALRPLYQVGGMFVGLHQGAAISNLDWHAVAVWVAYWCALFVFLEGLRYLTLLA